MQIIKGNKTQELTHEELKKKLAEFSQVVGDVGTGDGRFVYKQALQNKSTFYIGIDPSQKQLELYSKEANKKKLKNVIFVAGSIENMPAELFGIFDELTILLPWGSLLQKIVQTDKNALNTLFSLVKDQGTLMIIFGYDEKYDPSEVERLGLDKIDQSYIKQNILPKFNENGFVCIDNKELGAKELRELETSWAKKLSFGNLRPWNKIIFKKTT